MDFQPLNDSARSWTVCRSISSLDLWRTCWTVDCVTHLKMWKDSKAKQNCSFLCLFLCLYGCMFFCFCWFILPYFLYLLSLVCIVSLVFSKWGLVEGDHQSPRRGKATQLRSGQRCKICVFKVLKDWKNSFFLTDLQNILLLNNHGRFVTTYS